MFWWGLAHSAYFKGMFANPRSFSMICAHLNGDQAWLEDPAVLCPITSPKNGCRAKWNSYSPNLEKRTLSSSEIQSIGLPNGLPRKSPNGLYSIYIYILEIIKQSLNPLRVYILYPLDTRKNNGLFEWDFSIFWGNNSAVNDRWNCWRDP